MAVGRVSYRSGLLKVIAWDGMLPLIIILVPRAIELLVPRNRGAIEFAGVMLPIALFFVRFVVGKRHIVTNRCGAAFRCVQLCALCFGILVLLLIDSMV